MLESIEEQTLRAYRVTHARVSAMLDRMTDEQLQWRPAPHALPAAFHIWHIARWADYFAAAVPGMTPILGERLRPGVQIWEAEGLAEAWGWPVETLGFSATGMQMDEALAARLAFPAKTVLAAYVSRAFAAAELAMDAIDVEQFDEAEQPQPLTEGIWQEGTVGSAVFSHLLHDNRHLGAVECLLGAQMASGTATV
jgi:hypothetical protein